MRIVHLLVVGCFFIAIDRGNFAQSSVLMAGIVASAAEVVPKLCFGYGNQYLGKGCFSQRAHGQVL